MCANGELSQFSYLIKYWRHAAF